MSRLLKLLPLLLTVSCTAQIHVSQRTAVHASYIPLTASFSDAPAPGDVLVALIGYYTPDTVVPPYGWTLIQQQSGSSTTGFTSFYHVVALAEANKYTFTGIGNSATMRLYDLAGADLYHPINGVGSSAQQSSSSQVTSPAATPTVAGSFAIAAVASEGSQVVGVDSPGWIFDGSISTSHAIADAYFPVGTPRPISATFALTNADSYGMATTTILLSPFGTTGHAPTANPGGPYAGVTGFAVSFDGSASIDPRNEQLTYTWNFGDGSTSSEVTPNHAYSATGSYTVSLSITNTDGYTANAITVVTISQDCSSVSVGDFGAMNGFIPSATDAWHTDISTSPVDPMSDTILLVNTSDLAGHYLHPDFGGNGQYGIPYTVVDSMPGVPIKVTAYPDESDLSLYPVPANVRIEGSPGDCQTAGDNHAIVFDKHSCVAYEMFQAQSCSTATPRISASSTAIWDFTKNEQRPIGYTSVDAAGLSVFEGLVRYDEVAAGVVNHAIRFTAKFTKNNANGGYFTAPATHASGNLWGTDNVMGMRIRLKANYDISNLGAQSKVIATAMKKYGMILADNGSNLYFTGTSDPRWDDDDLNSLKVIPASAFEVVSTPLSPSYQAGTAPFFPLGPIFDANNHPTGNAPVITSFTTSSTSIAAGQSVTLTPVIAGASYSYIDNVGFIRGAVTVSPTTTTTYTLTSRNAYGSTSAQVTVDVVAGVTPTLQFTPISNQTLGSAPFSVSASSASNGAVTYSVLSGPASIAGNIVTLLGVGTVSLQANQAASGNYLSATATTSFDVVGSSASLQFNPIPDRVFSTAPFAVFASSPSSGAITYSIQSGPATIVGNMVSLTAAGTVSIVATQAAAGPYTASSATISFKVTPVTVTLKFNAIADQNYGAAPFVVSASSPSPASVTYAVTSGPATIAANVVTLTGAGTVSLQASQPATATYSAATTATSFQVKSSAVTLQFVPVPNQVYGAPSFPVVASSLSSGSITYTVLTGPATISANLVTVTGTGEVTLQANQSAAGNYSAAATTVSFQVMPAAPALTITNVGTRIAGDPAFAPSAASPSQGALTWTLTGPATLANNLVSVQGAGMVTLSVSQAAAGNYAAATASTTFAVQDFQLSAPSLITLPAGSTSSANVVISGQEGFTGTVGVTCSMPASMTAATCSATNVQLSPSASQSTATMTIATVKVFSQASNEDLLSSHKHALLLALLAPLAFLRRKSRLLRLAVLVLGLGLAGSAIGCGSGVVSGSSTGTFNVTVSAVSGTAKHTAIVPVVVQ